MKYSNQFLITFISQFNDEELFLFGEVDNVRKREAWDRVATAYLRLHLWSVLREILRRRTKPSTEMCYAIGNCYFNEVHVQFNDFIDP